MNKMFTLLSGLLLLTAGALLPRQLKAQVPQKMSYQAVIRNSSGQLAINAQIGMQISILQGSADGTAVYVETHSKTTNDNGLVALEIGMGTPVTGTFSDIDWSTGSYFIKTETDPIGGTVYSLTGTSQILSVPYALYARESANGFSGNYDDLVNKPTILNNSLNTTATGYMSLNLNKGTSNN